jgi:hypothetical protein
VATLARDLDVFAPSVPTGLTAIFLPRGNVTKTREVRALGVLLICHLQFSPFRIPFLLLSINSFLPSSLSALI